MCIGFFTISEEKSFDERTLLKLDLFAHFLHVKDGLMLVKLEIDGKIRQKFETLLPIGDGSFLHKWIIFNKSI